jgi:hypothetical protein
VTKKHVYRQGDRVRIVNSRFIRRVGYPLTFADLRSEFENHPQLLEAMRLLGIIPGKGFSTAIGRASRDFVEGCAKAAVRARRFGGPERSIHYYPTVARGEEPELFDELIDADDYRADCSGQEATVLRKRVVMTGTYYPPSGGLLDDDWESGGLSDMKAHVLLSTDLGEIEACDVEPLA